MRILLLLLPLNVFGQCLELGSAFTFTECYDDTPWNYTQTCEYEIEWYTSIEFIVPLGSTETYINFTDVDLWYSHVPPPGSDLWLLYSVTTDCENTEMVYTNSGWCDSQNQDVVILPPDECCNEPFMIVLDLDPGVYYLHLPHRPTGGGTYFSGCFTVEVFSMGFLDLGVPRHYLNRTRQYRRYDVLGRRW